MFETVIAAMLKHKQVVFAAIAVTALIGYIAPPGVQVAQATSLGEDIAGGVLDSVFGTDDAEEEEAVAEEDDDDGVDQDLAQDIEQDQEASNEADQDNEQSQTNIQANDLETGDNTATNTANNDADQEVTAVSGDASAAAEAESEADGGCCDDGHHGDGPRLARQAHQPLGLPSAGISIGLRSSKLTP
jgi:preprotein translocase subunit SecF